MEKLNLNEQQEKNLAIANQVASLAAGRKQPEAVKEESRAVEDVQFWVHQEEPVVETNEEKKPSKRFETILRSRDILKQNKRKAISFRDAIITYQGRGMIYPNTINVIQGKKGVHKSRLVEIFCSSLLTKDPEKYYLDFKADSVGAYSVLYVDTERNLRDQLPYALQQIQRKAGYFVYEEIPNLDCISLNEIDRQERLPSLSEYLEYVRKTFKNHLFIVLDVVTDCVCNFNDPKESLRLIDLMNKLINQQDVTFLCVIHENPNSVSKARGHLGTELINKASTVIQIGFDKQPTGEDSDLIKVRFLHSRTNKRPEPFFLQYNDTEKGLVIADPDVVAAAEKAKKMKAGLDDIKDFILEKLMLGPMERPKLIEMLKAQYGCGERTIEERLKFLLDTETPMHYCNIPFRLHKEHQKRMIYYSLVRLEEEAAA